MSAILTRSNPLSGSGDALLLVLGTFHRTKAFGEGCSRVAPELYEVVEIMITRSHE